MHPRQALSGKEPRQEHDQERPKVADQACLGGGRQPKCREIQKMIAKEAKRPEGINLPAYASQLVEATTEGDPAKAHEASDSERQRIEQEWRYGCRAYCEHRQERPE